MFLQPLLRIFSSWCLIFQSKRSSLPTQSVRLIQPLEDRTVPAWSVELLNGNELLFTTDDVQNNLVISVETNQLVFADTFKTITGVNGFSFDEGDGTQTAKVDFTGITRLSFTAAATTNSNVTLVDISASEVSQVEFIGGAGDDQFGPIVLDKASYEVNASGGAGNDTLGGDLGNDTLDGGTGNDLLYGGGGDDLYLFDLSNGGADGIDTGFNGEEAGAGIDTIQLIGSVAATLDLANTTTLQQVSANLSITLDGFTVIENIVGGSGNDTLLGNGEANDLDGGAGDDSLSGGAGNDDLDGGSGNDIVLGGTGDDLVDLGDGDDQFIWNDGDNSDIILSGTGSDTVAVNGSDVSGDDFVVSPNGADVQLDRTNLVPFTLDLSDTEILEINGQGGDDTVTGSTGLKGLIQLKINGGTGDDSLSGGDSDDTISGGAGDDDIRYISGGGADVLDGGDNTDFLSLSGTADDVVLNFNAGTVLVGGQTVQVVNLENLVSDVPAKTLTVVLTAGNDDLNITDDGTTNNKFSLLTENNSGLTLKFFHPTDLFQLNLGGGNDTVAVTGFDTALLPAQVKVFGEIGADTVTFDLPDYAALAASRFNIDGGTGVNKFIINGKANEVTFDRTTTPPIIDIDGTIIETPAITELNTNVDTPTLNLILAANQAYELTDGMAANDNISQFFNLITNSFVNFVSPTANLNLFGTDTANDSLTIFSLDSQLTVPFTFDGKAGSDTLEIATGAATDVILDLNSATFLVDMKSYGFTNTEQLVTNVPATKLKVDLSANASKIEISDDGDNANQFSFVTEIASGFKLKFFHPTTDLLIEQSNDTDSLKLSSFDTALTPTNIRFDGGGNTDTFELGGNFANVNFDLVNNKVTLAELELKVVNYENYNALAVTKTLLFTLPGKADSLLLSDDGLSDNQMSLLTDELTGTIIQFLHPTDLLQIDLGAGDDLFQVTSLDTKLIPAQIQILGSDGNDTIGGTAAADSIDGGLGNDLIFGGDGGDTLNGNLGDDSIDSGNGDDMILGGAGNDQLFGGTGADMILAEADNDSVNGGDGNDTIDGGLGADLLFGDGANDSLLGQAGDDIIGGGSGNDTLLGDTDNDLLFGEAGFDSIVGSEGDDSIGAGSDSDFVDGGIGNDLIFGEDGDDFLIGGAGNDAIGAGNGADRVNGGDGSDLIFGEAGNDSILAGTGADSIGAGADADLVEGDEGDDLIYGEAGNDTLLGGAGNDSIGAGAGADFVDGGADAGADLLFGEADNDTIFGNAGADSIGAGAGDDSIESGDGNDLIFGEAGNDVIRAGNGDDAVSAGTGNDFVQGDDGDDILFGEDGNDTLNGGPGNDFLDAFIGIDLVVGADGNDTLVAGA